MREQLRKYLLKRDFCVVRFITYKLLHQERIRRKKCYVPSRPAASTQGNKKKVLPWGNVVNTQRACKPSFQSAFFDVPCFEEEWQHLLTSAFVHGKSLPP